MKLKYALIAAVFAAINVGGWFWWRAYELDHSQDEVIIAAASIYDMDPALIKAVIWRESRFNPDAVGAAGELGLMQIRDAAAGDRIAPADPGFGLGSGFGCRGIWGGVFAASDQIAPARRLPPPRVRLRTLHPDWTHRPGWRMTPAPLAPPPYVWPASSVADAQLEHAVQCAADAMR